MKKSLLALSLCLPLTVSAANTITFLGEVSDTTCNINVNGSSGDLSVQLPTVSVADLSTSGNTAGEKDFTFTVSDCTTATQTQVGMRLVAPVVHSSTGNLENIAATTPATNVAIQILDGNSSSGINFSSGEYHSAYKALTTAPLTFPFKARYISTASGVTAGKVEAKLEYALSYN